MPHIKNIIARQIFDSRGNPTIETDVILSDGTIGRAAVPSGASTGKYEAYELRDNQKKYHGKSVMKAVSNVNNIIFDTLTGLDSSDQELIDSTMIELDGSKNKKNLGANAILSVSLATATASANSLNLPLYKYLGGKRTYSMPTPMLNVINGGAHANNKLSFQEFMIIPQNVSNLSDALRMSSEVFHSLKEILNKKGHNTAVGDEGGFAPDLKNEEEACKLIYDAIKHSGYKAGKDFVLGLDIAAGELFKNNKYVLASQKKPLSKLEFSNFLSKLCVKYNIVSIEDPFAEDDWTSWINFTAKHGDKMQIVGDDLFVTNIDRIKIGIEKKAANAVLIKINQIGTLSETIKAIELAQSNGMETVISHRSGETENTFISDLAVACNSGQIKTGSMSRSDRVAKYNQLLRIEENFQKKKTLKINKFV